MITTIIFDMNGVITDDEDFHELATKQAFEKVGLEVTPEIYRKFCLGRTDAAAFADLIKTYDIGNTQSTVLIADKSRLYMVLVKDNLRIYPGVVALIQTLSTNYRLALTTSSTYAEAYAIIDLLQLHDYFEVVVTSGDVRKGKPDPEPYLLTSEKLGVTSQECLVIEDSENGVKSAKAAGMKCVAITNTEKPDKLQLADRILNGYLEITEGFIQSVGL